MGPAELTITYGPQESVELALKASWVLSLFFANLYIYFFVAKNRFPSVLIKIFDNFSLIILY